MSSWSNTVRGKNGPTKISIHQSADRSTKSADISTKSAKKSKKVPSKHKKINIDKKTDTKIVNISKRFLKLSGYRDLIHWLENTDNVYIGRDMSFYVPGAKGSKWKNPFKVAKPGKIYKRNDKRYTLEESINEYRNYVLNDKDLMEELYELKNKTLGCWCKPNNCHGDILIDLVNTHVK